MATDLKTHLTDRVQQAAKVYVNDLQAMPEDLLANSPGGVARTPYDFTYELVFVNKRILTRLQGGDPGPFPQDGWMTAPDEFKSKEKCIADFEKSVNEVLTVWEEIPEEKIHETYGPATGVDLVSLCGTHISYHDAQLNYLQAMNGDGDMHWD